MHISRSSKTEKNFQKKDDAEKKKNFAHKARKVPENRENFSGINLNQSEKEVTDMDLRMILNLIKEPKPGTFRARQKGS